MGSTGSSGTTGPVDPSGTTDPSTSDESTTQDSSASTTLGEETAASTEAETEDSSSTGGDPPSEFCDDSLDALRACYDFAGADLGTLSDGSMHDNDGTSIGVVLEASPFGVAARVSAASEMSVPDSAPLDISGDLTFEAWVRLDSLPLTGRVGILDNDGQYSLIIFAGPGLRCGAGGGQIFFDEVPTDQWFHVACVHEGSDLSMWIDGTLATSTASTGASNVVNPNPMSLADTSPAFMEPMDGLLGGVRIWNIARSPAELAEAAALLQ